MKESQFTFQHPSLVQLQFQRNEQFRFSEAREVELKSEFNTEVSRDECGNAALVALTVHIEGNPPEDGPFTISATMVSLFSWDSDALPKERVNALLAQNAPALLLGYLRPIIANTIQLANLPPYHIPFMDFTENSDN